ncbi:MAG: hypothetical protein ACREEK_33790 [Bradyrhizobium sp.]
MHQHIYDGTLLVFLGVAGVMLERPGFALVIGSVGVWLVAR